MDENNMAFWDEVDLTIQRKEQSDNYSDIITNKSENKQKTTKDNSDELVEKEEKVNVVIMTAVEDEYKAACKIFGNFYTEKFQNGFKYRLYNYEVSKEIKIKISIFKPSNMGLVSAAMTATCALNKFSPDLLLMCGVCAGVEGKSNLGDLIVFSPVYNYGSGKYGSGVFSPDYRQYQISGQIKPIVEEMSCDTKLTREIKDAWGTQSGKPQTELQIHIYPCGSGAAVIADERLVEDLKTHQRTLGAIDMESYAIAEVANSAITKEIPWLVVKGVQDFANPLKNDEYREYAAFVSGMFIKKFLEKWYFNL